MCQNIPWSFRMFLRMVKLQSFWFLGGILNFTKNIPILPLVGSPLAKLVLYSYDFICHEVAKYQIGYAMHGSNREDDFRKHLLILALLALMMSSSFPLTEI